MLIGVKNFLANRNNVKKGYRRPKLFSNFRFFKKGVVVDMNLFKKNQVIIYTVALMLVTAGYLNYTSNVEKNDIETSSNEIAQDNIVNESLEESNLEGNEDNSINENDKIADIGDATLVNSNDVVTDYFAKSKLERDSMYSQMIESYEKILNSSNSLETQRQSATQEIKKINDVKNKIMICENLIQTKGFENCVVFVNDSSVSVIVGSQKLKQEEVAQIQNIVSRELNVKIENLHISTK